MSRKHLYNAASLHEETPGAARTLIGRVLPINVDRAFAAPIDAPITLQAAHAEGCAEVRPSRRAAERLEHASPHLTTAVWAALPRHPVTRATHGAAGDSGRIRELERILNEVPDERQIPREEAPFVLGHIGHLCADLGLSQRAAEESVMAWLGGRATFSSDQVRAWMRGAIEGGAFYECNGRGAELDAEAEEREAREEAARKAAAPVAPVEQPPKSDGELGRVTIRIKTSILLASGMRDTLPPPLRLAVRDPGAEWQCLSFDRGAFCGAKFRAREIFSGVEIAGSDFVRTDCLASETIWPSSDMRGWLFQFGRPGSRSKRTDAEWDARTAEGREREAQFEKTCEAMMPRALLGPHGGCDGVLLHMLADAGHNGFGLADDIIDFNMQRTAEEAWAALHAESGERDDARGEALFRFEKILPREASWIMNEGSKTVAKGTGAPPPLPRPFDREAHLRETNADAPALFDRDELYVAPAPGVLDRIWHSMTADPMAPAVEAATEGKDMIRSADLEEELVRAGHVAGELTAPQHARIHKIMTRRGWKKAERTVDGRRCKVFVRISSDKATE